MRNEALKYPELKTIVCCAWSLNYYVNSSTEHDMAEIVIVENNFKRNELYLSLITQLIRTILRSMSCCVRLQLSIYNKHIDEK